MCRANGTAAPEPRIKRDVTDAVRQPRLTPLLRRHLVKLAHRVAQQHDKRERAKRGAEGNLDAVEPRDDQREQAVPALPEENPPEQVAETREYEGSPENRIEPPEDREELLRRRRAFCLFHK